MTECTPQPRLSYHSDPTISAPQRKSISVALALFAATVLAAGPRSAAATEPPPLAKAVPATAKSAVKLNVKTPYPAPQFSGLKNWVNSDTPLTTESLKGKVVLVDFWTFGCINCQNTLPHVRALYAKYHSKGFEIVGIHAPEFGYEADAANVRNAVKQYRITWPVAQDNGFSTWRKYRNQFWPAMYYIDRKGFVRHFYAGEGQYERQDAVVAALLAEPV